MVKRVVVWTETAARQRRDILRFWVVKNKSTKYSEKLIKLIKSRLKVISNNPLAFKLTNHNEIRVSSLGQFSIYYQLTHDQLIVVAFWDNRQNPNKISELINKKVE